MKLKSKQVDQSQTRSPRHQSILPTSAALLTGALALASAQTSAQSLPLNIHVDPTVGSDGQGCGRQIAPCESIEWAIDGVSQPGDVIQLVGSAVFPVEGVEINHDLSIYGTGSTVLDANGNDRHFLIEGGASVTLNDMELVNGLTVDKGGSIYVEEGQLTLSSVLFENNQASYGGAVYLEDGTLLSDHSDFHNNHALPGDGGAISCFSGSAEIFDSSFIDNSAQREGGSIETHCDTSVRRSDFLRNSANIGGAIHSHIADDAVLEVKRSQFSENTAYLNGGAISVEEGATDIRRSSFILNEAFDGGGIFYSVNNTGPVKDLTVVNSTFSSNIASNEGGAINANSGSIHFVTMVDNWAESERGLDIKSYASAQDPIDIYNTLINHNPLTIDPNTALLCHGNADSLTGDGNMIDNDSCGIKVVLIGSHNYASLGPLRLNGGRTLSHKLMLISGAVDAAMGCNGPNGLNNVDQRGAPRPETDGVICDIGAFER